MCIRLLRRGMVALLMLFLTAFSAASCDEAPKRFSHAFPGSNTNVSAPQALEDFRITVPREAEVVGYYATSTDDEYPMAAVFRMPCASVSGFVSENALRSTSSADGGMAAVEVFAGEHGWSKVKDNADVRYFRSDSMSNYAGLIVHRVGARCTVYLDT